jgi:hypothetical protein
VSAESAERLPRIRLSGAQRIPVATGQCRVRVKLEAPDHKSFLGTGEDTASLEGELHAAAHATVDALRQAIRVTGKKVELELREVATFDAFGKPGVMVSLRGTYLNTERPLLGFAALENDVPRSVVKAVLSATNRFLAVLT